MGLFSSIFGKVIAVTSTIIVSLGFFSHPVPAPELATSTPVVNHLVPAQVSKLIKTTVSGHKDTGNLLVSSSNNPRDLPGSVVNDLYQAPYIPLIPRRGYTKLKPSGADGAYSKEDAVVVAEQQGFFRGMHPGDISTLFMRLGTASSTDKGEAWFAHDLDYHTSVNSCPKGKNVIVADFEMNTKTGLVIISNSCGFYID